MDFDSRLNGRYSASTLHTVFQTCSSVCTDTRKITPNCLFFALHGDNFDGNDFALQALEQGAAYVVVDDEKFYRSENPQIICLPDTLEALQVLARYHRSLFEIPVIAITGSNGKTTTKALCATVLSGAYKTLFTQGNLNNHIGVPLTLLQITPEHEVAIIEMGANHQHEIEMLCDIARPTHGLITNMGKAHLEGFGGEEGVRIGKSELYRFLHKNNGTVFYNASEPHLKNYIPEGTKNISYELINSAERFEHKRFQLRLESTQPFLTCTFWGGRSKQLFKMETHIMGAYNAPNIATAVCLGKYFKVPFAKIAQQICNFEPTGSRSEIKHLPSGAMLILDAYNANPSSMRVALSNLALAAPEKKIAILGDMFELGETALMEHKNIIEHALSLKLNTLVTVGKNFGSVESGERRVERGELRVESSVEHISTLHSPLSTHLHFANTAEAHTWLAQQNFGSDCVILLKGSRSMAMEKVL